LRLPFPVRISLWRASCFASFLFLVQLLEGTHLYFAVCSFLFIVVATVAFNLAGGFTRASGAYVFFYAILAVIFGLICKAFLGEPADSNLTAPNLTITVFLGGITAMLGAVFISRRLTIKRALLQNIVPDENLHNAAVGCMVIGFVILVLFTGAPHQEGSVLSALAQINRFFPMAILLGVIYQIRKSGGKSSVNLSVLISAAVVFGTGLLNYGKEAMFTPLVCWGIAAMSQRYKIVISQVIGGVIAIALIFYYLVPYSQYGRNFRDPDQSLSDNIKTSLSLLSNLDEVRKISHETEEEQREVNGGGYFNTPQGLFDRLQMISVDDGLIAYTDQNGTFGPAPIILGFQNLIPHFLWKDKPNFNFGNSYAHELGFLAEEDTSTGISFSPSGEGFHVLGWMGVLVVAPLLWTMVFTLYDSLCGDVRKSPWGLLVVVYVSHVAPEGGLGGLIYMLGYLAVGLLFMTFSAAYVMPIIGTLVAGPEKRRIRRVVVPHSVPRRVLPRRLSSVAPPKASA
jgi:hypothetical protein